MLAECMSVVMDILLLCCRALAEAEVGVQVCPVEGEWAEEVLPKLRGVDVERLSGGATAAKAAARPAEPEPMDAVPQAALQIIRKNDAGAVDDARKRFLARKAARKK